MIIFAISIGATNVAYFHLITHALFKSIIFLCAGIVIHNSSYQDIRHIGSIFSSFPIPISILGLSSIALIGIPFISGFFSKDAIIESLINYKLTNLTSFLIIFSITLTSMYSIRIIVFSSKFTLKSKPDLNLYHSNIIENPISIISLFSVFSGSIIL